MKRYALSLTILTLLLIATASHAVDPVAKCQAAKAKATGQRVYDEMRCRQRAFVNGAMVDPLCISKAESKFLHAIEKADAAGSCPGVETDLQADVDACVVGLVTHVGACLLSADGATITCDDGAMLANSCSASLANDGLLNVNCGGLTTTLEYGSDGVFAQLTELQGRLVEYQNVNGHFPVATAAATPAATCCGAGGVHDCPANPAAWNGIAAWDLLGFEITTEHNYVFSYSSVDGTHAQIIAEGDFYCTGVVDDIVLDCDTSGGVPACTLQGLPLRGPDGSCTGLTCDGIRATFNDSCTFAPGIYWTNVTCGGTSLTIDSGLEEAVRNLFEIQSGQWDYLHSNFNFVVGTAAATPAATCCAVGGVFECPANPSAWQGVQAWDELGFSIATEHQCVYSYNATDGYSAVAVATCDLDCDGTTVDVFMDCYLTGAGPSCSITLPASAD